MSAINSGNYHSLVYKNRTFRLRVLSLLDWGDVLIATRELQNCLLPDDGDYLDIESQSIDESIFYFVDEYQIALPSIDLQNFLQKQVF
jgi:hypothetical protein